MGTEDEIEFGRGLIDDTEWSNLIAEIRAIAAGTGVFEIEGDAPESVEEIQFCFTHPIHTDVDREVAFVFSGGEWRAKG